MLLFFLRELLLSMFFGGGIVKNALASVLLLSSNWNVASYTVTSLSSLNSGF